MLKIHLKSKQQKPTKKLTKYQSEPHIVDHLHRIPPDLLQGFDQNQLIAIEEIIESLRPKPSPKLVDLRLDINLLFSRFYIVLLVGKDRRKQKRSYLVKGITKVGNVITAISLLLGLNFTISLVAIISAYLIKILMGINLFKSIHFIDVMNNLHG